MPLISVDPVRFGFGGANLSPRNSEAAALADVLEASREDVFLGRYAWSALKLPGSADEFGFLAYVRELVTELLNIAPVGFKHFGMRREIPGSTTSGVLAHSFAQLNAIKAGMIASGFADHSALSSIPDATDLATGTVLAEAIRASVGIGIWAPHTEMVADSAFAYNTGVGLNETGGTLDSWEDQGPNEIDLTSIVDSEPAYNATHAPANDQPSILFDSTGDDDGIEAGEAFTSELAPLHKVGGVMITGVFHPTGAGLQVLVTTSDLSNSTHGIAVYYDGSTETLNVWLLNGTPTYPQITAPCALDEPHSFMVLHDTSLSPNVQLYIDTVLVTSEDYDAALGVGDISEVLTAGRVAGAASFGLDGHLFHLQATTRLPTSDEISRMQSWLKTVYTIGA